MQSRKLLLFLGSFVVFEATEQNQLTKKEFDPNDCYESGTNFDENEKNLGYCPCKYGHGGNDCFEIFDCVVGELRKENCSREIQDDYDLQWRCAASENEIVTICTCPEGFRGETCEFIMENTLSTYWKTVSQSQKFFEVIYNKSDTFCKIAGTKVLNVILKYRRLIMFVIFICILTIIYRQRRRQNRQLRQITNCQLMKTNRILNLEILKNQGYHPLGSRSLEEADALPKNKMISEDSVSRSTEFSEVSELSDDVIIEVDIPKISRPHLHI